MHHIMHLIYWNISTWWTAVRIRCDQKVLRCNVQHLELSLLLKAFLQDKWTLLHLNIHKMRKEINTSPQCGAVPALHTGGSIETQLSTQPSIDDLTELWYWPGFLLHLGLNFKSISCLLQTQRKLVFVQSQCWGTEFTVLISTVQLTDAAYNFLDVEMFTVIYSFSDFFVNLQNIL